MGLIKEAFQTAPVTELWGSNLRAEQLRDGLGTAKNEFWSDRSKQLNSLDSVRFSGQ